MEPKIVFKNLFVQIAYNQKHQLSVARQVCTFLGPRKQDIRLLVVNNITKFFREAKHEKYAADILKQTLGILCKVCARNRMASICTGDANITSKGVIPRPIGGTYFKHAVNVIVHFGEFVSYPQAFGATLIKHQYSKTPKSAVINARKTGRTILFDALHPMGMLFYILVSGHIGRCWK
jgi:hypothetical protein